MNIWDEFFSVFGIIGIIIFFIGLIELSKFIGLMVNGYTTFKILLYTFCKKIEMWDLLSDEAKEILLEYYGKE